MNDGPIRGLGITGSYFTRQGRKLAFRGQLEQDVLYLLDYEPSVESIEARASFQDHTFDCSFRTKDGSHYLVDILHEESLAEKWDNLRNTYDEASEKAGVGGLPYGIITEASIEELRHRVIVLKKVDRVGKAQAEKSLKDEVASVLTKEGRMTARTLAEKTRPELPYEVKLHAVCNLIREGIAAILETPTDKIDDCWVALDSECSTTAPFLIPYPRFVKRMMTHPSRHTPQGMKRLEGRQIALGGVVYDIVSEDALWDTTLKCVESGEIYRHVELTLLAEAGSASVPQSAAPWVTWLRENKPKQFKELQRRLDVVRRLDGLRNRTDADFEREAKTAGYCKSEVYRLLRNYKTNKRDIKALSREHLRGTSNSPDDGRRADRAVESLTSSVINEWGLTKERRHPTSVHNIVTREVERLNSLHAQDPNWKALEAPSLSYVSRKIRALSPKQVTLRCYGSDAYEAKYGPHGGEFPDKLYPLHTIAADNKEVPVMIVDEEGGVIGKPYLTLGIDVFSRCIWSFSLSIGQPEDDDIGRTIVFGCLPKGQYIKKLGLDCEWPIHGMPEGFHVDNGMDYSGSLVGDGCDGWNIKLTHSPPHHPWFKAHIERFFRTLDTKLISNFRGKTFSSALELREGDYKPELEAHLTITQLERFIVRFIAEEYHNTPQDDLGGATPLEMWKAGLDEASFPIKPPADIERFKVDFYSHPDQGGTRTIGNDGVHFAEIVYTGKALVDLPRHEKDGKTKKAYRIRYDPTDIRDIYIFDDAAQQYRKLRYRPTPYLEVRDEPITYSWWQKTLQAIREKGNRKPTFSAAYQYYLELRHEAELQASGSKKVRKAVASSKRDLELRDNLPKDAAVEQQEGDGSSQRLSEYRPKTPEELDNGIRFTFPSGGGN